MWRTTPPPRPRFAAHEEASCQNCGGDLGGGYVFATANPRAFEQACVKCGTVTRYSLPPRRPGIVKSVK